MYLEKNDNIIYFDLLFIIIIVGISWIKNKVSFNPLFVGELLFQIRSFLRINGKHGLKSWIMTKMESYRNMTWWKPMKNLSLFEYIYDKGIPQLIIEKRSCGGFRSYLEKELME